MSSITGALNNLQVQLDGVGKKFGSEWIFKNLHLTLTAGDKLVILGGNGSGKSTLLQIISGYVLPNTGKITFKYRDKNEEPEKFKDHLSIATPYLELIEDYSFSELIDHCKAYKPFLHDLTTSEIIELAGLSHTGEKYIKNYSSGMKQRVKLTLAILADCELLLLDEPVSNLDKNAIDWYNQLVQKYAAHKTIVICSNSVKEEFQFCTRELNLSDYK